MKKPIYLADILVEIKSKTAKTSRAKVEKKTIRTFVLSEDIAEVRRDPDMLGKLCAKGKIKKDKMDVKILSFTIISQHGYTNDRF